MARAAELVRQCSCLPDCTSVRTRLTKRARGKGKSTESVFLILVDALTTSLLHCRVSGHPQVLKNPVQPNGHNIVFAAVVASRGLDYLSGKFSISVGKFVPEDASAAMLQSTSGRYHRTECDDGDLVKAIHISQKIEIRKLLRLGKRQLELSRRSRLVSVSEPCLPITCSAPLRQPVVLEYQVPTTPLGRRSLSHLV